MNIAVLGATGRTGVAVVQQALERGHVVQALVRSSSKAALLPDHDRLIVVEGDLLDESAVTKVVDGVDAVINVAGHVKGSPKDLQQRAIAVLLPVMRDRGVRRIVTLTGAGVRHPDDRPKPVDRVFGFALKLLQPGAARGQRGVCRRGAAQRPDVDRGPGSTADRRRADGRVPRRCQCRWWIGHEDRARRPRALPSRRGGAGQTHRRDASRQPVNSTVPSGRTFRPAL